MNAATGVLASVHPVVRVVSFILLALFLALGDLSQLAVTVVVLALLYLQAGVGCLVNAWPMLRRMRWFFLSILLIYSWLTPGQPLWVNDVVPGRIMPTIEGVLTGGHRLLALALMVLAVQWLLWVTSRAQLVSALYWLVTPLAATGLSRERLAVRVALVLDTFGREQERVSQRINEVAVERGDLRGYAAVAASLVSDAVQQGEEESCHPIEINIDARPPLWQWLWPLVLSGVMLVVVL